MSEPNNPIIDFLLKNCKAEESSIDVNGIPDFVHKSLKLDAAGKSHKALDVLYENMIPIIKAAKDGDGEKFELLERIAEYAVSSANVHLKLTCLTLLSSNWIGNRSVKFYDELLDTVIALELEHPGISYGFKKYGCNPAGSGACLENR